MVGVSSSICLLIYPYFTGAEKPRSGSAHEQNFCSGLHRAGSENITQTFIKEVHEKVFMLRLRRTVIHNLLTMQPSKHGIRCEQVENL